MTVAQKIQALKGATIGAVTVGGAPAQVVRYLLRQNNLKPTRTCVLRGGRRLAV